MRCSGSTAHCATISSISKVWQSWRSTDWLQRLHSREIWTTPQTGEQRTSWISIEEHDNFFSISLNDIALNFKASFRLLGIDIRACKNCSPSNLTTMCKVQIRPLLDYCSHIWGTVSPTTVPLLDSIQNR